VSRCYVYSLRGDWPRALADLHEALRCDPNNGHFYAVRANILARTGQWDGAITDYREAIRRGEDEAGAAAEAHLARAVARLRGGDLTGALADCDAALKLDPTWPKAQAMREIVLTAQRPSVRDTSDASSLPPLPPASAPKGQVAASPTPDAQEGSQTDRPAPKGEWRSLGELRQMPWEMSPGATPIRESDPPGVPPPPPTGKPSTPAAGLPPLPVGESAGGQ
jgi:tetratricopeptide (TPR) repeat protein